jgi:hypothetical protein
MTNNIKIYLNTFITRHLKEELNARAYKEGVIGLDSTGSEPVVQ